MLEQIVFALINTAAIIMMCYILIKDDQKSKFWTALYWTALLLNLVTLGFVRIPKLAQILQLY